MFSFNYVMHLEQYRWANESLRIMLGTKEELKYKVYRLYMLKTLTKLESGKISAGIFFHVEHLQRELLL